MNTRSGTKIRPSALVPFQSLVSSDLHPDLQTSIVDHPFLGKIIDHPLVRLLHFSAPFPETFADTFNGASCWADIANKQLAAKQKHLERSIEDSDWATYVFLHERPYRFEALTSIVNNGFARLDQLWPLVGEIWSDSENIWQCADEWLTLWRQPSRRKRAVMTRDDRDSWRALPDNLTIYRGVNSEDEVSAEFALMWGQSWTLNREKAIWFANRKKS